MEMEFSEQAREGFQKELTVCLEHMAAARQQLTGTLLEQLTAIQYEPLKNQVVGLLEGLNGLPSNEGDSPMTRFLELADGRDAVLTECRQWSRILEERLQEEFRAFPLEAFRELPAVSVKVSSGDYDGVSGQFQRYAQEVRQLASAYQSAAGEERNLILQIAEDYVSRTYLQLAVRLAETAAEQMERSRREFEDKLEAANRRAQAAAEGAAVNGGRQSGAEAAPAAGNAPAFAGPAGQGPAVAPVKTEEVLSETEETPSETEETPAETEESPAETEEPPVETEETPAETEEPPVETEETPTETEEPPVETEEPPAETEEPPVETEEPPVETEEPSAETEEPSAERKKTPAERETPPSKSSVHPDSAPPKQPADIEEWVQKKADEVKEQYPHFYAGCENSIKEALEQSQTEEEMRLQVDSFLAVGKRIEEEFKRMEESLPKQQPEYSGPSDLTALHNNLREICSFARTQLDEEYMYQEAILDKRDKRLERWNNIATGAVALATLTAGLQGRIVLGGLYLQSRNELEFVKNRAFEAQAGTTLTSMLLPKLIKKMIPPEKLKAWRVKELERVAWRSMKREELERKKYFITHVKNMLEVRSFGLKEDNSEIGRFQYFPLVRLLRDLPDKEAHPLSETAQRKIEACFIGSLCFLYSTWPPEEKGQDGIVSTVRPGKWEEANEFRNYYSLFLALNRLALQDAFIDQAFVNRIQSQVEAYTQAWFNKACGPGSLNANIDLLEYLEEESTS
ncbi:hypothetical protein [uncultured Oscillibacter sp.]|uniref:hypothetical protein n=1 Tax=uncultured Oscillibacter sp. TaxID=876091 RepID=UPI002609B40D|nr:hypothetical protein [uncultured Oscillibacter sp.]